MRRSFFWFTVTLVCSTFTWEAAEKLLTKAGVVWEILMSLARLAIVIMFFSSDLK